MSNLANVVQLRRERDLAQKRIGQLDEALKALTGLGGARGAAERRSRRNRRRGAERCQWRHAKGSPRRSVPAGRNGRQHNAGSKRIQEFRPRFPHSLHRYLFFEPRNPLTSVEQLFSFCHVDG